MSVRRIALVVFLATVGVLALLSVPLVAIAFGGFDVEAQAAFVAALTVALVCLVLVVILADLLGERAWRSAYFQSAAEPVTARARPNVLQRSRRTLVR
ncbi:MAG: hypothetical protein ABSB24_11950 [Gaiellaceae bacterium]